MDPLVDYLSQLSPDIFIQQITYLPFHDVINVCSANKKLHGFCNDPKYNNNWERLIDNTFKDNIYAYEEKLKELWNKLNMKPDTYNYLVYAQIVKLLDPVTQAMIYYQQGDMESFEKLNEVQRFLALFLLGKRNKMIEYFSDRETPYSPFLDLLKGDTISQDDLDRMLIQMATAGNIKGIMLLKKKGANQNKKNMALIFATKAGHLEVVKYLVEHGAHVPEGLDITAILHGHPDVSNYLTSQSVMYKHH